MRIAGQVWAKLRLALKARDWAACRRAISTALRKYPSASVLVGLTPLHPAQDTHQAGVSASLFQYLLHPFLLALFFSSASKFYLKPIFLGQSGRIDPDFIPQRFGKLAVIKDADPCLVQILRHPFGIPQRLQIPADYHPVIAMQYPGYFWLVFFCQQLYRHFCALSLLLGHLLYFIFLSGASQNPLFGSGSARL